MSITAAIKKMIADGFTVEQALAAAEAFEHAMTPQKTARQERNARYYASKKRLKASNSSYSDESVLNKTPSREPARVEDNLQTKNSTGQKENKKNTRASDEAAFRADLSTDLPADLLDGVVKLRREKRGQVTALSARLFRDDAAACGMSVSDAAQACVSRNWITVKPEYFRDRQHRGQGPPAKQTHASMWRDEGRELGLLHDPASSPNRRLETGLARGPDQGTNLARRITGAAG